MQRQFIKCFIIFTVLHLCFCASLNAKSKSKLEKYKKEVFEELAKMCLDQLSQAHLYKLTLVKVLDHMENTPTKGQDRIYVELIKYPNDETFKKIQMSERQKKKLYETKVKTWLQTEMDEKYKFRCNEIRRHI